MRSLGKGGAALAERPLAFARIESEERLGQDQLQHGVAEEVLRQERDGEDPEQVAGHRRQMHAGVP